MSEPIVNKNMKEVMETLKKIIEEVNKLPMYNPFEEIEENYYINKVNKMNKNIDIDKYMEELFEKYFK